MEIKEIIKKLCGVPGVSGAEFPASGAARDLLAEYAPDAEVDSFGNVSGNIRFGDNLPTLLLDAHIDEIGMVITYIEDGGFLRVAGVGGLDCRTLQAQTVTVWGNEPFTGVIATVPPHLSNADDGKKAVKVSDIAIDTGYTKEELDKLCEPGNPITVNSEFTELLNNRVSSGALDDRCGVAAVLFALSVLDREKCKYNIKVSFASQEEVGCRGAVMTGFRSEADFAVSVDVSYGLEPGVEKRESGIIGKGVMLGISPVLDRLMFNAMKRIAEERGIPYQLEIMNGSTGTNADKISLSRSGIRTSLLSIPERNMHMPVELIQISDVEDTGRLIAGFLESEAV